jgi:hypothetical protein
MADAADQPPRDDPALGLRHPELRAQQRGLGPQTVTFACLVMPDGNANVFGLSATNGIELTFR